MITRLRIDQFRKFGGYHVTDLRPVNLLVGENGSGKTTVLEVLHFLRSPNPCSVLTNQAWHRGEVVAERRHRDDSDTYSQATIEHFFMGHSLRQNERISASYTDGAGDETTRFLQIVPVEEVRQLVEQAEYGGRITEKQGASSIVVDEFTVGRKGIPSSIRTGRFARIEESSEKFRVGFQAGDLGSIELRAIWDALNQERRENDVYRLLRDVLDPNIEDLFFEAGHNFVGNGRNGALVGYTGTDRRIPIGSLGNGVFQLLCLAVKLQWAANGIALFDEIGTGLHWSRMGEMWRLIIESARQNNTQIFATTHSLDCLKGLSWVCENYEHLGQFVSVQSIKPELDEAVALPGERLPFAMSQEIEVR
ncbi:MAG: AAA family ATPase [Planctomycetaceae bacterium]|nr:AAA family ATPase [Planctomycetaceae bacterium]